MGRMFAILGFSVLAGCDVGTAMLAGMAAGSSSSTPVGPTVSLKAVNQGAVPVRVQIVVDHLDSGSPSTLQQVELAPSESTFQVFGDVSQLRVRVMLVSSLTILLYEAWDQGELDSLGDQVTVTVSP